MADNHLRRWQPSKEEVERILAEMRPIIAELVRKQFQTTVDR